MCIAGNTGQVYFAHEEYVNLHPCCMFFHGQISWVLQGHGLETHCDFTRRFSSCRRRHVVKVLGGDTRESPAGLPIEHVLGEYSLSFLALKEK